jgi:hypothetical protein
MQDIEGLLNELNERMRRDWSRMKRWSLIHRTNGVLYTLVLILAPAVLAVGLISSDSVLGKSLLFAVAVVGSLNVTFKPYLHGQRRRTDMSTIRRLHDEYKIAVAVSEGDNAKLVAVYEKYSAEFSDFYDLRGGALVDAALAESAEAEGKDVPPRPSTVA